MDDDARPWLSYWKVLFPDYAAPSTALHWYGKWKTQVACIGLWDARETARAGRVLDTHQTVVVRYRATPTRAYRAQVCLTCDWISRSAGARHGRKDEQR